MSGKSRFELSYRNLIAVFAGAVATSVGCGESEPYSHVQVAGKVTYEDGSLIAADFITVTFLPLAAPINAKTHARPGEAEVDVTDGTFNNATTHKFGDGVTAGDHKILIKAFDADMNVIPSIPRRYADPSTTPLEANTEDSPFHFKIAK